MCLCVHHLVSSAYFPQSNGRGEVAVKTAKRLLMTNTGPTGSLDHDRFLHAMLQLRNTPDPDCNVSPAEIIYGHPLRDAFAFVNRLEKFSNPHVRPLWRQAWTVKEDAPRTRLARTTEALREHSRPLRPLAAGDHVFLQNQTGTSPGKWDRSGTAMESLGKDQYWVKVDGSGRLTRRNRRFLREYTPATPRINRRLDVLPLPLPQDSQTGGTPASGTPMPPDATSTDPGMPTPQPTSPLPPMAIPPPDIPPPACNDTLPSTPPQGRRLLCAVPTERLGHPDATNRSPATN